MNPLDLLSGPALLILFPLSMLILLRVIAPHGVDLDGLLRLPSTLEWPRGIQEEEPVRWRVELLSRWTDTPRTGAARSPTLHVLPVSQHATLEDSIRGATASK